jgi:hypothetical protein
LSFAELLESVEVVELFPVSLDDSAGGFFFLGLATVSDESESGPCCASAAWNEIAPSAVTTIAASPALKYFIQSPLTA